MAGRSRRRYPRPAVSMLLLLVGLLMVSSAAAQVPMREFTGRVDSIDEKRMTVDNRMQDRMSFVRVKRTRVEGQRSAWSELRAGDRVSVSWRFVDKPKKAYIVRVLSTRSKRP